MRVLACSRTDSIALLLAVGPSGCTLHLVFARTRFFWRLCRCRRLVYAISSSLPSPRFCYSRHTAWPYPPCYERALTGEKAG